MTDPSATAGPAPAGKGTEVVESPLNPDPSFVVAVVQRFNAAFERHDVDAVMALMTDDCVFENTAPPPDGERHEGQAAVRDAWLAFFAGAPAATFAVEETIAAGDRCVVRWRYQWGDDLPGKPGHVRGVDVFRIANGKVAEKLSYVKG